MAKFDLMGELQKIPPKTRRVVFGFMIGAGLVAFVYFWYIPKSNEIKSLQATIAQKQQVIAQNEERIKRLDELKARVQKLHAELAVMKEKLPPESEVSGLLREVQNLVNKSGLALMLWKIEKRKPGPENLYEEIPITVNLIGGYHNFGVFLDLVARLRRIVNIINIRMDSAKLEPGGAIGISIKFTAMTYAATESKGEAKPTTPGAARPPAR